MDLRCAARSLNEKQGQAVKLHFVKKGFFKRFNFQQKKKGFCDKKSLGGGEQMDKFSMPKKGILLHGYLNKNSKNNNIT